MSELTAECLRELLHYDPETGVFTRRITHRRWKAGENAGCLAPNGYFYVRVDRKLYLAHRLIWLWMTDEWPKQIDHINGIRTDNRWANLRIATHAQNHANRSRQRNNTTGYKGVTKVPRGLFQAQIMVNRRNLNLGWYHTAEAAHWAYCEAAKEHFGEFANPG